MTLFMIQIRFWLLIGFIASQASFAEEWQDPAKKYINAYKQYLDSTCPIKDDSIKHFVYFIKEREEIHDHAFLRIEKFAGAQIMYSWDQLETEKDHYDFSLIKEDYEYLKRHEKKLFIQLQDVTFYPIRKAVPHYLLSNEYDGGVVLQITDDGVPDGWVAKRWNSKVRERFKLLLDALGKEFDGKVEGVNLQETAIGVSQKEDASFSPESYVKGLKANMLALKTAFPTSTTMQYANFMPGEWLPWEDKGYLRSVYQYGEDIGVGLGGPDLMYTRKGQLNHTITLMHEGEFTVPLGIAIQDGNYTGKTGADKEYDEHNDTGDKGRKNIVPVLFEFAKDFLDVNYIFWVNQAPYFEEDVATCLRTQ